MEVLQQTLIDEARSIGCVLCRSSFELNFHHIIPEEKSANIHASLDLDKLHEELDKCVVLCSVCHGLIHGSSPPPSQIRDLELYVLLQSKAVREHRKIRLSKRRHFQQWQSRSTGI